MDEKSVDVNVFGWQIKVDEGRFFVAAHASFVSLEELVDYYTSCQVLFALLYSRILSVHSVTSH